MLTDPGTSIPMGQGDMSPNFMKTGTSMVNILEVMSFRMSTRVSTRNYVPNESGWRITYLLYFSAWKIGSEKYVLNVYFAASFILSSCCLLYFDTNIICSFTKSFTKKLSFSFCGTSSPRPPTRLPSPYRGSAGELPSPRPPVFFYVPPPNNPVRSTPLIRPPVHHYQYHSHSLPNYNILIQIVLFCCK